LKLYWKGGKKEADSIVCIKSYSFSRSTGKKETRRFSAQIGSLCRLRKHGKHVPCGRTQRGEKLFALKVASITLRKGRGIARRGGYFISSIRGGAYCCSWKRGKKDRSTLGKGMLPRSKGRSLQEKKSITTTEGELGLPSGKKKPL